MSKTTKLLKAAVDACGRDDIRNADLICRQLLDMNCRHPLVFCLLALISCDLNEFDFMEDYLCKAVEMTPSHGFDNDCLSHFLTGLLSLKIDKKFNSTNSHGELKSEGHEKFLLIKAWGWGFWSDVDHVLGQLLLAEMTERIPVVHWGSNSDYKTPDCDNAFDLYFETISQWNIYDLLRKDFQFYSTKWTHENLLADNNNQWSGPVSCMAGIQFFNRPEDVVVSDFYTSVNDLIPWIKSTHPLYGLNTEAVYQYLVDKYLKVKPEILKEIDDFCIANMIAHRPLLAIHMRGGGKFLEDRNYKTEAEQLYDETEKYLSSHPEASIFLLTDDERIKDKVCNQYGRRVIMTECTRASDDVSIHVQEYYGYDPYTLGREVLIDTYLAAKCDHFIGMGWSNVACMISHLKDWPPGSCVLLGDSMHSARLLYSSQLEKLVPMKVFLSSA